MTTSSLAYVTFAVKAGEMTLTGFLLGETTTWTDLRPDETTETIMDPGRTGGMASPTDLRDEITPRSRPPQK